MILMANQKLTDGIQFRFDPRHGDVLEYLASKQRRKRADYVRALLEELVENGTVSIPITLSDYEQEQSGKGG